MKIILVVVTSIDGITYQKGKAPEAHHEWTSQEDKDFFNKTRDNATLIFMGRKTYEGAKSYMVHSDQKLRIVFTKNPEQYQEEEIRGQLEFTNENPKETVTRLEKEGYTDALLVGGASINVEFFTNNLVTEVWQTVEPMLLGEGAGILGHIDRNINLELLSQEKLNDTGTLLLKYKVI